MTTKQTLSCTTGHHQDGAAARMAGIVSLVVLAVGLGGFALGIEWVWIAFPVGYGGVLPLAVGRARSRAEAGEEGNGSDDPLETLRERYARGDIDEVEFERRVERLLSSEPGDEQWD